MKNPTILSENISLEYLVNIDEETDEVLITQPTITYDEFRAKHIPKPVLMKFIKK